MSADITSRSMPSRGTKYSFMRVADGAAGVLELLRGCLDMALKWKRSALQVFYPTILQIYAFVD